METNVRENKKPEKMSDESNENQSILKRFRAWRVQHQENLKKNPVLERRQTKVVEKRNGLQTV